MNQNEQVGFVVYKNIITSIDRLFVEANKLNHIFIHPLHLFIGSEPAKSFSNW